MERLLRRCTGQNLCAKRPVFLELWIWVGKARKANAVQGEGEGEGEFNGHSLGNPHSLKT